jgi:SprB repeat
MKHKYNLSSFTNYNLLARSLGKSIRNLVMIGFWALVLMPQVSLAQGITIGTLGAVAPAPGYGVDANVTCFGNDGSIYVNPDGGSGTYSYKVDGKGWCSCTDSFRNLAAGTHTVYVTDGSIDTLSATILLEVPNPILASFEFIQHGGCDDTSGIVVAHITGGNNYPLLAYQTFWRNASGDTVNPYTASALYTPWGPYNAYDSVVAHLSAGIYSVTVADNSGCIVDTFSFNLTNLCVTLDQAISCPGASDASFVASTSATGSWMYNINGGLFDNLTGEFYNYGPATYTIGITDGIDTAYNTITITDPAPFAVDFTWDSIPDFNGNLGGLSALITGGTPDSLNRYHTAWTADSSGALLNPIPNNLDNYVGGLATGVFTLSIEDEHGCVFSASDTLPDYNLVLDMPISCYGSNDGRVESYTNAIGNWTYSFDDPLNFTNTLGTFENLTPGTHTMGITDGVHRGYKTILVPGPDSLDINFAWDSLAHCNNNGGGLSAIITGGTISLWPDYLSTWTNSANSILNPAPNNYNRYVSGIAGGVYTLSIEDENNCHLSKTITIPDLCLILDQAISCYGAGDASVVATSSVPGSWMYNIDGGSFTNSTGEFYGLSSGVHTIGITDGTFTAYDSIAIMEPDPLVIAFTWDSVPDSTTNTGGLSALITGGTRDSLNRYNTAWTNSSSVLLNILPQDTSVSGLVSGNYTLSVEDQHGCTFSSAVTLPDYTLILDQPISCNGNADGRVESYSNTAGNWTFNIDGGVFNNTSGAFENLTAGTHTMGITDGDTLNNNHHVAYKTIFVPEPGPLAIAFTWDSVPDCNGHLGGLSALALNISGGTITGPGGNPNGWSDYLTEWRNSSYVLLNTGSNNYDRSVTGLPTGIYTLSITDENNCNFIKSITLPDLCLSIGQVISCHGVTDASIVATTSAVGSWMYNINGGAFNSSTGVFSNLAPGTYTIGITGSTYTGYQSITITEPDQLAANVTIDSTVSCHANDGKLSVHISGGTPSAQGYFTTWTLNNGPTLNPAY